MATAHSPTEPVLYAFIALRSFSAPEVGTIYMRGMKYYVREGNTKLADLVDQWVIEGFVKILL